MKAQKDRLYKDIDFLTSIAPARNYQNLLSLEKICDYLKAEFSAVDATPEEQTWLAEGNLYKNIIATYNPEKRRRLIVGAHYDVAGDQPGADDNASAVAGLLETARMVFTAKPDLEYRIDFVSYCLEEPPFFGSQYMGSYVHAKSLYDSKADVMGMICYEMIGYFSDKPNSQPFPSPELAKRYPHVANFIMVVGIEKYAAFNNKVHKLMATGSGIDVQVVNFASSDSNAALAGLSDQRSYWSFDYPAFMINDTAFVRNPNYHQKSDTIDTLDFDKLTEVINSTYKAVIGLG
jgi:hypothetical protein